MRTGTTLLELIVALALGAIVLSWALPRARAGQDRLATRAAQQALVGAVRTARLMARSAGSSELHVRLDSGAVHVVRPQGPGASLNLHGEFGVTLTSGTNTVGTVRLRFDRSGLGRFASRSFTIARGASTRGVVVSTYGRVDSR